MTAEHEPVRSEGPSVVTDGDPGDPEITVVASGPFAAEAFQFVERHHIPSRSGRHP